MKKIVFLILLSILTAAAAVLLIGCPGDDSSSDEDDDDEDCEAQEIGGVYSVVIAVTQDDCMPENVGDTEEGSLEIVQHDTDTDVQVWFTEFGPGQEAQFLFEGTACGTQVIGSATENNPVSGKDCTFIRNSNFTLTVDLGSSSVSGNFSGTYIWSGTECEDLVDNAGVTCPWSKSVTPN